MNYAILAAGQGSRFVREGISTPKPLVPILGEPMIGRLIRQLTRHDAERINVVANRAMPELADYLRGLAAEWLPVEVNPIVSDNSYYSLACAAEGLEGKFIAMTVDTIFPDSELGEFVRAFGKCPSDSVLMGLTRFCDDESPLYARIGADGCVCDYRYGGEPFEEGIIVSAGLYGLTSDVMAMAGKTTRYPVSLSDFQKILAAETDVPVRVFEFTAAMDVDNTHDVGVAEAFLRTHK